MSSTQQAIYTLTTGEAPDAARLNYLLEHEEYEHNDIAAHLRVLDVASTVTERHLDYVCDAAGPDVADAVRRCGHDFRYSVCENGDYRRISAIHCQHTRFCPSCHDNYNKERALEVMRKFEACTPRNSEFYTRHMVFTLPREFWDFISYENVKMFFRAVNRTLQRVFKGYKIGGVVSFHSHGDVNLSWMPHIDVVLNGWLINKKNSAVVLMREIIDYRELRMIYKEELNRVFNFNLDVSDDADIDIYDDKLQHGAGHAYHAIKYSTRLMIDPHAIRYDDNKKVTYVPDARRPEQSQTFDLETFVSLMNLWQPDHFRRIRGIGYMSDSVLSHTAEKVFSRTYVRHDKKKEAKKCPICNGKMQLVGSWRYYHDDEGRRMYEYADAPPPHHHQ